MSDDTVRAPLLALALTVASLGGAGTVGAVSTVGTTTVDTTDVATSDADASITAGSVLPEMVERGATVSNQRVSVRLRNLSADGRPDSLSLVFPDALVGNLTLEDAAATGNVTVATTHLVDGPDDDGRRDTVEVRTNASGGGGVDTTVDLSLGVTYPDRNATYAVDAVLLDSQSGVSTADSVAVVVVGTGVAGSTSATNASRNAPAAQDVDVTLSSPEDVEKAKVKAKSKVKNATLATLPGAVCPVGSNRTPFVYNQDVDVYVNNSTGDIGKLKVKVKSKVKKIDLDDAPRLRVNGTNASARCTGQRTAASEDDEATGVNGLLGWENTATAMVSTGESGDGRPSQRSSGVSGFGTGLLGGSVGALVVVAVRALV